MKQNNTEGPDVVAIDYDSPGVPDSVRALKPVVFKDGDSFCCLLGTDPQEGVFGCGKTAEEALFDWDAHLKTRGGSYRDWLPQ